jgi:sec-independent protein translocase protein TatA
MGFGGISPLSLILILAIIVLLFGTKKLRNIGGDLGNAIKNFKNAMSSGEPENEASTEAEKGKLGNPSGRVIDAEVDARNKDKV